MDGFHRATGRSTRGLPDAYATIRLNSTWEEVYDRRILAASTHRAIRFARVVEWIEDAWRISPWADQFAVDQAFNLFLPGSSGKRLGLNPDQADEVRRYLKSKSSFWKLSPATIRQNLAVAKRVDPILVRSAREGRTGESMEAVTPEHLKVLANLLPDRHEHQRLAANIIVDEQVPVREAQALVSVIGYFKDVEEAARVVEFGDWRNLIKPGKSRSSVGRPVGAKTAPKPRPIPGILRSGLTSPDDLHEIILTAEVKIGQLLMQNTVLSGLYTSPPFSEKAEVMEELPRLDGLTPPELIWTANDIDGFEALLKSPEAQISQQLAGRMSQDEVEDILRSAKLRLMKDIHDGVLSHVVVKNQQLAGSLLTLSVRDEIRLRNQPDNTPSEPPAKPYGESVGYKVISAMAVSDILPTLNEQDRQILLLRLYYSLTTFAIAQVIQKPEAVVSESLVDLHDRLSNRLVVRQPGRLKETAGAKGQTQAINPGRVIEIFSQREEYPMGLTSREVGILYLIAEGYTNREIGSYLFISEETVKSHVRHVLAKTDSPSRTAAVSRAHSMGVFEAH